MRRLAGLTVLVIVPVVLLQGQASRAAGCGGPRGRTPMTDGQFRIVLDTVAAAWNTDRADLAVACFTDTAVYMEPPDRQLYRGREALRQFFADSIRPAQPDRMRWHVVAFDVVRQVGIAEYTYRGSRYYHGTAVIRLDGGLIASWREYQSGSDLPWERFVGASR